MKNKKIIFKGMLVIIWMIIIFLLSSQNGSESADLTNSVVYTFFEIYNVSHDTITFIIPDIFLIIRKIAHFTEYFILGILFMNLLKEFNISSKKRIIYSILFCLLYATTDEFHQLFISNRVGSIFDVLIDFSGSISGIIMFSLYKTKITLSKR